jgi:copper transport protein
MALATAATITWIAPRLRERAAAWAAATVAIVAFAATQPLAGHPAAAERPLVAVLAQLVHIVGAGAWLGGLAMLTAVAIPAARSVADAADSEARIAGLVRAFSPTALAAAALLGLTGVLAAWTNLGGVAQLWQSGYGRTLLLKLALLSVVAGTGAYNWRRVLPALGSPSASAALRRSSLIELAAATAVLIVTAVLVATPMPGE